MLEKKRVVQLEIAGFDGASIQLRDVQLWRQTGSDQDIKDTTDTGDVLNCKGKFLDYIDVRKLPLWLTVFDTESDSVPETKYLCFTSSTRTLSYFESKLRYHHRGIVVEVQNDFVKSEHYVFHRVGDNVEYIPLNFDNKKTIDERIKNLETEKVTETEAAALAPVSKAEKGKAIDSFVKQTTKKNEMETKNVMKSLQVSDRRIQFNQTLSKLILGGLRLRGILNTQSGFHKLYKMTFTAAEFAHRTELHQLANSHIYEVPFENLQQTVETLLKLFTQS